MKCWLLPTQRWKKPLKTFCSHQNLTGPELTWYWQVSYTLLYNHAQKWATLWSLLTALCLYTAHLWAVADQQGTDTFLHCEANSVKHLPSSLVRHLPSSHTTNKLCNMSCSPLVLWFTNLTHFQCRYKYSEKSHHFRKIFEYSNSPITCTLTGKCVHLM